MDIHGNKFFRMLVLFALKQTAFDLSIKHHWTGERLWLNSFRHKGYWYHGRNRECSTMQAFKDLIAKGDTVIEVGGHVGYLSLWFAELVGPSGHVVVFEPGQNNLPYTRKNLQDKNNVTLVEKGCGPVAQVMKFYEENLTGQNNSFVKDFGGLLKNSCSAPGVSVKVGVHQVEVCRLDEFVIPLGRSVDFIKIDTEGYEWQVLSGCNGLLAQSCPPKFMVEVQADELSIFQLFMQHGYQLYDESRRRVDVIEKMCGNLFALHPLHHAESVNRWVTRK